VFILFVLISVIFFSIIHHIINIFIYLVLKMVDERWVMYDGFSDTGKHSTEWVWITKKFLKLAFAGGHREASCPCNRCENRRMLSKYEMFAHFLRNDFCRTTLCGTNTERCNPR
jgi:hypothetical protein